MSDENQDGDVLAFSRPFRAGRVAAVPFEMRLEANEEECAALACLWNVASVGAVTADLRISAWRREGVRVVGTATAHLTQSCVATLEPIVSDVVEEIDATFLPEGSRHLKRRLNENGEMIIDPDGADEPETFAGGDVDIGAVVAEAIALGIDPYPRKADAPLVAALDDAGEDDHQQSDDTSQRSPFAALKDWKSDSDQS